MLSFHLLHVCTLKDVLLTPSRQRRALRGSHPVYKVSHLQVCARGVNIMNGELMTQGDQKQRDESKRLGIGGLCCMCMLHVCGEQGTPVSCSHNLP